MHTRPSDVVKKHFLNAKWGWVKEPKTTNIKAVDLARGYTISHIYKFKFIIIQYDDERGAHGRKKGGEGSMRFSSGEGAALRGSHLGTSEESILFTLKNDCDFSANNPRASRLLGAFSRSDDSNDICCSTSAAADINGTFRKSRIQPRFSFWSVRLAQMDQFHPLISSLQVLEEVSQQSSFNLKALNNCTGEFWWKMFDFVSSTVVKQPPLPWLKHTGGGSSFTLSLPSQQVARFFFSGSWNRIKAPHLKIHLNHSTLTEIFLQDQRAETSVSPKLFHLW